VYVGVMAPVALRGPLGVYVRPRLAAVRSRLARRASPSGPGAA
jgi:hypothetical protein